MPRVAARAEGRRLFDAVLSILDEVGRPMHARDLVERLAARDFAPPGREPVAALNTQVWKRARTDSRLVRHGDAIYAAADRDRP